MKKRILALLALSCVLALVSLSNPLTIPVDDDPDNCLDNLEVPKRFTPDGNDTLDVFTIDFPCVPESFEIQIFDRFQEEVFIVKTHVFEWNGLNKKQRPCESGIYSWKIRYMYHMSYVERKGQLLLLR